MTYGISSFHGADTGCQFLWHRRCIDLGAESEPDSTNMTKFRKLHKGHRLGKELCSQ